MQSLTHTHHQLSRAARPFSNGSTKQRLVCFRDLVSRSSGAQHHQQQEQQRVRASQNQPSTQQQQKTYADMTIDDLDTSYCDDFVCTSSPAVEQTVRSLVSVGVAGTFCSSQPVPPTATAARLQICSPHSAALCTTALFTLLTTHKLIGGGSIFLGSAESVPDSAQDLAHHNTSAAALVYSST